MNSVVLLIGGNLGNRRLLIDQATEQIRERIGSVVALSGVYETEPWGDFDPMTPTPAPPCREGMTIQGKEKKPVWDDAASVSSLQGGAPEGQGGGKVPNFLNRALLVETTLSPWQVLRTALAIEASLGRYRPSWPMANSQQTGRLYHSRPMDIDLIFYDDLVVNSPELTLPHPRMYLRRFVLEPLAEICPDYRHPLTGKTVREMLAKVE